MSDNLIVVNTIEGLYDERADAVTMNISNRKFCIKHNFINGSLHWEKEVLESRDKEKGRGSLYHISLEADAKENFNRDWGKGYGGIRFCRYCKLIDCIHQFTDVEYRVNKDEFEYTSHIIGTCAICKRLILKGGCTHFESTPESWALIMKVTKEMGIDFKDYGNSGYGSNYYTILPANTAREMKISIERAETYIRNVFNKGECR